MTPRILTLATGMVVSWFPELGKTGEAQGVWEGRSREPGISLWAWQGIKSLFTIQVETSNTQADI